MKRRDHPNQLFIDWQQPAPVSNGGDASPRKDEDAKPHATHPCASNTANCPPLTQRLPWDFRTTFPQPTDQALDEGVIQPEDNTPDGIKSIHDEHAREALAALHDLDAVLDARRRGVDPATGKPPRTHASRERLRQFLKKEPDRLTRHFDNLLAVYRDAFGPEAGDAFEKAIRAWHAGIEVIAPSPRAILPVPKPLAAAVAAGHFGQEEDGRPVKPSPEEVRAITAQHAWKLAEHLAKGDQQQADEAVRKYADDFGERPARQLAAYARREVSDRTR